VETLPFWKRVNELAEAERDGRLVVFESTQHVACMMSVFESVGELCSLVESYTTSSAKMKGGGDV